MLEFSRRNDPWPFHVDEAAAALSPYGGSSPAAVTSLFVVPLSGRNLQHSRTTWAFLGGLDWKLKFRAHGFVRPTPCERRVTVKTNGLDQT